MVGKGLIFMEIFLGDINFSVLLICFGFVFCLIGSFGLFLGALRPIVSNDTISLNELIKIKA